MLTGSELYVILKLSSGEQVMAILKEEDEDRILLETPMCIRTIPVFETSREHVTASPLCQFSDDKIFVIHKKDIMFCKKLHHVFIPHYQKIVAEHEKQSFVTKDKTEHLNDNETMTVEDAVKQIDILQSLLQQDEIEEENTIPRNFVQGNDTIN
jgi:hypothetical protein